MTQARYEPTREQAAIIDHAGDAFVQACPGAGKTRTLVERARRALRGAGDVRGVAFLSFTNAAVNELETRLRGFGVLPTPLFPSFIGTFDRFLWQFLIAPFGVDGCDKNPRLVPDKENWEVRPFDTAQPLTLKCFDRQTGAIIPEKAAEVAFASKLGPGRWEARAKKMIAEALKEGRLDFDDVRLCVAVRLADAGFRHRVGAALAARFKEIVVDEAQDCNSSDLKTVEWLREAGVVIKVICDPNQAIYAFRGGVTDELLGFAASFSEIDRLPMSGNFRSSSAICAAISQLRPQPPAARPTSRWAETRERPFRSIFWRTGARACPRRSGRGSNRLPRP